MARLLSFSTEQLAEERATILNSSMPLNWRYKVVPGVDSCFYLQAMETRFVDGRAEEIALGYLDADGKEIYLGI